MAILKALLRVSPQKKNCQEYFIKSYVVFHTRFQIKLHTLFAVSLMVQNREWQIVQVKHSIILKSMYACVLCCLVYLPLTVLADNIMLFLWWSVIFLLVLLMWISGTNVNEILNEIHTFLFKEMHLKMSSAKWQKLCLGLNVLTALVKEAPAGQSPSIHFLARILCDVTGPSATKGRSSSTQQSADPNLRQLIVMHYDSILNWWTVMCPIQWF